MSQFKNNPSLQKAVLSEVSTALNKHPSLLNLELSFIKNGGDSLSSMRLQTAMKKHGIHISIGGILAATKLLDLAQDTLAASAQIETADMVSSSSGGTKRKSSDNHGQHADSLPRRRCIEGILKSDDTSRRYPMTEMQLSMVHSTQSNPNRNIISYFEVHRSRNIPALKHAWETVLRSEPIFNMVFVLNESGGYMHESQNIPFIWEEVVVTTKSSYQLEESSLTANHPIGTSFKIISLNSKDREGKSTVIWRVHHALIDGASFALVRRKVQRVLAGERASPGPSFTHFSFQLRTLQNQARELTRAFWARRKSTGPHTPTRLLVPTSSTAQMDRSTVLEQKYIDSNIERLAEYATHTGVTLASLYYAAWGLVLAKFSDANSVSFGAVLSGRALPIEGIQSIIGPTINTLPFHISLNGHLKMDEYIREAFSSLLELISFQWSTPSDGFSRNLSTAMNIRLEEPIFNGSPFDPIQRPYSRVISDFSIHVEVEKCGRICLNYNPECFDEFQMKRMCAIFARSLDAILEPGLTVSLCLKSLIGPQERTELARLGNWDSALPRQGSVKEDLVTLFERAAEANPNAVAIEYYTSIMTYAELDFQSSIVARQLLSFIQPGDVVCVHSDGTVNWIVAIYAVLKAGATYCPFDHYLTDADRSMRFKITNAKVFLTGDAAAEQEKPAWCELRLSVAELLAEKTVPPRLLAQRPKPTSNAYICFTSGSTGKPKGVLCRHEGLVAFQTDFRIRLCARPGWKIAQFMSPGFDGSIHEIFSALSYGSTLVLKDSSKPFNHLKRCDAAILTPSVAKVLNPTEFSSLKVVYLVGEAVPQSICDDWAPGRQLFNMYGPSEATCGATIKKLVANTPVTLGLPNPSTRLYILDSNKTLVPRGVIGEIYLAGTQVATGYVGYPPEMSDKFSSDSINPQYGGEMMYKTGDLAYWTSCGELSFLGRADRQVKLRGFRIDLDDLEARIASADKRCKGIALVIKEDNLVAYVQPDDLDLPTFRSEIRRHIPIYALPHHIIAVKSFYTTPAGKLDYGAMVAAAFLEPTYTQATISSEENIATALKDVLGLPANANLDYASSFSSLGGNSILALRLKHRLSGIFKQHVSVQTILESANVRELAERVTYAHNPDQDHATMVLGEHVASPIEKEWWCKYKQGGGTCSFNVSYACQLPSSLDREKLISAWNAVLLRHRIFRCRYRESNFGVLTREHSLYPPTVKRTDAIDVSREVNIPLNIGEGETIRVLLSPEHMLVLISHIMCDLTTLRILLGEVSDAYHGKELPIVLKTYFQTTRSVSALPHHLAFWSNYLGGAVQSRYSIGKNCIKRTSWAGSSHVYGIHENIYHAMMRFASEKRITMHQLAVAAVTLALQNDSTDCDIVVGAPYFNRNSEEDLDIVGLFLEPLPVRIRYPNVPQEAIGEKDPLQTSTSAQLSQNSFIESVQQSCRAALSHAVPWDQLLSHLNIEPDFPNHPIFDTMVTFHEADHGVYFPLEGIRFIPTWSDGAKFKLMAEFTARENGTLSLRLEYSTECFTEENAKLIRKLVLRALEGLIAGDEHFRILHNLKVMRNSNAC